MKIAINESISPMRGEFTVRGINRAGEVVFNYTDKNLIVNTAKSAIAKLISDPTADAKVVSKIAFGTNGSTPTPNDTGITDAYTKDIPSYSYPETNKVTFFWGLDFGEANSKEIAEFGLLCADSTLFARKVRGTIRKEEDLALEGEWTIVF